jgi:hypothetical protein
MADQFKDFMHLLKALDKQKVEYILIGGVAVILHGLERLTRYIDIFVKMDSENIKKLRKALYMVFKDSAIEEIILNALRNYPVIRYGTPNGFSVDIMTPLGEVIVYEDLEYEVIEYQGIKIRIGTPETLYNLKKNTVRYKDKVDAVFLKELIKGKKVNRPDK